MYRKLREFYLRHGIFREAEQFRRLEEEEKLV